MNVKESVKKIRGTTAGPEKCREYMPIMVVALICVLKLLESGLNELEYEDGLRVQMRTLLGFVRILIRGLEIQDN